LLPFGLGAWAARTFELHCQLLSMIQMLLHRGLCLLHNFCQLALRLLADYLQCGQHLHVGANLGADIALVELGAGLLLQLFFERLHASIGNLPIDLDQLVQCRVGALSLRRSCQALVRASIDCHTGAG
jgi:hypothetical protein